MVIRTLTELVAWSAVCYHQAWVCVNWNDDIFNINTTWFVGCSVWLRVFLLLFFFAIFFISLLSIIGLYFRVTPPKIAARQTMITYTLAHRGVLQLSGYDGWCGSQSIRCIEIRHESEVLGDTKYCVGC